MGVAGEGGEVQVGPKDLEYLIKYFSFLSSRDRVLHYPRKISVESTEIFLWECTQCGRPCNYTLQIIHRPSFSNERWADYAACRLSGDIDSRPIIGVPTNVSIIVARHIYTVHLYIVMSHCTTQSMIYASQTNGGRESLQWAGEGWRIFKLNFALCISR